ncbi:DUF1178 family protein [Acetobacter fallax]|uniref:DUF1178 family protein n=1 Tax=Acetobacter fallax TaxID=1737473 RepID=A0ABX0K8F8_9PROT|nr:DUF1178 family protein [Acetobacter fallax]NHO31108.1 DUF1178 family protein [Acetobacter fallax]NHO34665.1 DUF1178 family protein [Acetobacter fallax]
MILYQLRCSGAHEFEGWFRDSAAFEDQACRGLLVCPFCGISKVDRALMAPALHSARTPDNTMVRETAADVPPSSSDQTASAASPIPDVLMATLRRLRHHVETSCENVGDQFADEALRIHRGEAAERGIYGNMSEEQKEILEDEGVVAQALPWVSRADS